MFRSILYLVVTLIALVWASLDAQAVQDRLCRNTHERSRSVIPDEGCPAQAGDPESSDSGCSLARE